MAAVHPLQAYLVDCTTTLNDRCAREACSFDGKLVDDTLFTIRQTTPMVGNDVRVDVLVGMDNDYALMPLEVRCSSSDRRQPYATQTLFGSSLNGPVDNNSYLLVSSHFVDLGREID